MTKIVLAFLLIGIAASIKLRDPSADTHNSTNGNSNSSKTNEANVTKRDYQENNKIKVNGTWLEIENCQSYGVNSMFINFGCLECKSGSKLLMDPNGIGICQKETGIVNCDKSIQFATKSKITCLECTNGMGLSQNGGKCMKLEIDITPEGNSTEKIANCKQYTINSIGKIKCSKCISGFSLSDDLTNCNSKCKVNNCNNCFESGSQQYCNNCKFGHVGIVVFPFNTISKCISAKEWMDNIFAPLVKKYILDD